MYNHDLGPVKALIGYVRFVPFPDDLPPGEADRFTVEKMSYEEEDIDRDPNVVINATSEPCGIELIKETTPKGDAWVVLVGGQFLARHAPRKHSDPSYYRCSWQRAKKSIVELDVLQWMAMLPD